MSRSFFEDLAKEGVIEVEAGGKQFYFLKPTSLNNSLLTIMSDKDLTRPERMNKALACVLCDDAGNLEFDVNKEEDLVLISKLPDEYLVEIISELQKVIFPSKKK